MQSEYKPELWHDLFVMIGTSAGALVGLLFIVMSLHLDKISDRANYNMRATIDGALYNTIHLLVVLVEAAVVLTPQPLSFIGAELIAINVFGLRGPLAFAHKYFNKKITISHRGGFPTALILTIAVAYLLGVAGGVAAFRRLNWSLYLVTASCVIKIVRSVLTAWMLMFGMLQARPSEQGS
ncbi:MAG TPA: hypothetical protein VGP07_24855 [Polyangia bacterium]|jgi:hypothetical protein